MDNGLGLLIQIKLLFLRIFNATAKKPYFGAYFDYLHSNLRYIKGIYTPNPQREFTKDTKYELTFEYTLYLNRQMSKFFKFVASVIGTLFNAIFNSFLLPLIVAILAYNFAEAVDLNLLEALKSLLP